MLNMYVKPEENVVEEEREQLAAQGLLDLLIPLPSTKGRASSSVVTTLLPSALNPGAIDKFLNTMSAIPLGKIKELGKLMREHGVTFTSMYNTRGFPDENDIDGIIQLVNICTIHNDAKPVFLKSQFSSLCSTFTRQPFPSSMNKREELFVKIRTFLNKIKEYALHVDMGSDELLSSITGMLHGRGIPTDIDKENGSLDKFFANCMKRGGVEALKYVASDSSGMGIPTPQETERILNIYERAQKNGLS